MDTSSQLVSRFFIVLFRLVIPSRSIKGNGFKPNHIDRRRLPVQGATLTLQSRGIHPQRGLKLPHHHILTPPPRTIFSVVATYCLPEPTSLAISRYPPLTGQPLHITFQNSSTNPLQRIEFEQIKVKKKKSNEPRTIPTLINALYKHL